jgi:hypothetical protein
MFHRPCTVWLQLRDRCNAGETTDARLSHGDETGL